MDEQATQANIVKYQSCGHKWIGFYLPLPINQAVKIMKNLTCPKCAADASQIMVFDGTTHSAHEQS